jgi:NitT/TauT family transport system substrate-binding protein
MHKITVLVFACVVPFAGPSAAQAPDRLNVAIGQIDNWENQAPTLGQQAGILKTYNLALENVVHKVPARPFRR